MMTKWWGVEAQCPKCHTDCVLQAVLFSADGELKCVFACFGCKQAVSYKVFAQALAHRALMNDIESHEKRQGKGLITPPLALPAPVHDAELNLTADDKLWEHSMGISDDEPLDGRSSE